MTAALKRSHELPRRIRGIMKQLGHTLGRFDLPGQKQGLEEVREACRMELEALGKNRETRLRDVYKRQQSHTELMKLFAHLGVFGAMYFSCRKQIVRIHRARRLARVPKRRRRRPLDTRSLMDFSLLRTMLIPVILGFFLNRYTEPLEEKLIWIAALLFLNGIILYIPQFFSTGNRDSRMLSRVEGLLVGLGGALGILPGISAVGSALSVASICGVERSYGLNMALLMNMFIQVGLDVYKRQPYPAARWSRWQ